MDLLQHLKCNNSFSQATILLLMNAIQRKEKLSELLDLTQSQGKEAKMLVYPLIL